MEQENLNPKDLFSIKDWILEIASKSSVKVLLLAVALTLILLPAYSKITDSISELKNSINELKEIKEENKKLNSKIETLNGKVENLETKIDASMFIFLQQSKAFKEFRLPAPETSNNN